MARISIISRPTVEIPEKKQSQLRLSATSTLHIEANLSGKSGLLPHNPILHRSMDPLMLYAASA